MKTSTQILLPLALLCLFSFALSDKVSVTKSFHSHVTVHSPSSGGGGDGDGDGNSGSSGSENVPGADSFNACDPNNRPEVCTLEYAPVCGYIHNCEGGSCTSTFGNDCSACGDSNVDGYVNGACEDVQTTCDPSNRPEACTLIFTATCAVASDCTGPLCFENTSNGCQACSFEGVAYSLPGTCPGNDLTNQLQNCDPGNRPSVCTADYNPVCARVANCVGADCWNTAGNACSACADVTVNAYVPGECPS